MESERKELLQMYDIGENRSVGTCQMLEKCMVAVVQIV